MSNGRTRLFFGRLAHGTTQREMESLLKGYGEIREMTILEKFGFVDFRHSKDAEEVLDKFDGKPFRGEKLVVEFAKSRHPSERRNDNYSRSHNHSNGDRRRNNNAYTRTDNRILVRNLSSRANWQDLKDLFRRAGEVSFADAHKDRQGEGIVEFHSRSDMKYALDKFQDYEFRGKRIEVVDDSRDAYRSSRRGRSRSRSPRRHHSRSPRRSYRHSRSRSPRRSRRSPSPRRERDSRRSPSPRQERESRRSPSPRRRSYSGSNRSRSPYERHESNNGDHRHSRRNSRSPSPAQHNNYSPRGDDVPHGHESPVHERPLSPQAQHDVYAEQMED